MTAKPPRPDRSPKSKPPSQSQRSKHDADKTTREFQMFNPPPTTTTDGDPTIRGSPGGGVPSKPGPTPTTDGKGAEALTETKPKGTRKVDKKGRSTSQSNE